MTSSLWPAQRHTAGGVNCCWQQRPIGSSTAPRTEPIRLGWFQRSKSISEYAKYMGTEPTAPSEEVQPITSVQCQECERLRNQLSETDARLRRIELELNTSKQLMAELVVRQKVVSMKLMDMQTDSQLLSKGKLHADDGSMSRQLQSALRVALEQCKDSISLLKKENTMLTYTIGQWQQAYQNLLQDKSAQRPSFLEDITSILNTNQPRQSREPPVSLRAFDHAHNSSLTSRQTQQSSSSASNSLVDKLGSINTDKKLTQYQIHILRESEHTLRASPAGRFQANLIGTDVGSAILNIHE